MPRDSWRAHPDDEPRDGRHTPPVPKIIGGIDPDALKIQPPLHKKLAFRQRIYGADCYCWPVSHTLKRGANYRFASGAI